MSHEEYVVALCPRGHKVRRKFGQAKRCPKCGAMA